MRKFTKIITIPAALALCIATAQAQSSAQNRENRSAVTGASSQEQQNRQQQQRQQQQQQQGQQQLTDQQRNQQSSFSPQPVSKTQLKKEVTEINKASTFTQMEVHNMQNETLGSVSDLVFDPRSGKISYAVLSVGGVLGIGEKQIAVPLTSLRPQPGQNFLVLNMTKEQINAAPGLAENNWPSLDDPALGGAASSEISRGSGSISGQSSSSATESSSISQPQNSTPRSTTSDQLSSQQSTSATAGQGSSPSRVTGASDDKKDAQSSGTKRTIITTDPDASKKDQSTSGTASEKR